jgi:lipopolysaccharide export system protein LptA
MGNHHTIIKKQPAVQGGAKSPATADTEIFSDDFENDTKTKKAVYTRQVRVNDPQMNLTSGIATAWMPEKGGKPERIVAETNVVIDFLGSPLFTAGDIINLKSLAAKLNQPGTADLVSQYVSGQLSPATRDLLPKYDGSTNSPLKPALVSDFNNLIQSGPIYDAQRFAGVKLPPTTTNMIAQAPQGLDLVWLNRRLLLDAYPQELSKNNFMASGEKTHATGEMAVYTYTATTSATNEVLVLTGNPMLGRPAGWTTGDKIIVDLATRKIRSVGHSFSKGLPDALNKTNAPAAKKKTAK